MTAIVTTARVLSWAAEPKGAPPTGPLWDAPRLASPPATITDAAAALARRTAARLGTGSPPFGGRDQIGLGVVFLAAAVGGRQQAGPAALLAGAVAPAAPGRDPGAWYDLIARHGLAGPAVTALDAPGVARPEDERPLTEALLDASPLTAVLYRPAHGLTSERNALNTVVALLGRPRGEVVLATGLAAWSPLPPVLNWRAGLLTRLRHDHPELLLDVYMAARTLFAAQWDTHVGWASRQLGARGAQDPLAIATLRFWAPLAALERGSDEPLSALRPLMSGQDRALSLVRRFRLDQAGAA